MYLPIEIDIKIDTKTRRNWFLAWLCMNTSSLGRAAAVFCRWLITREYDSADDSDDDDDSDELTNVDEVNTDKSSV